MESASLDFECLSPRTTRRQWGGASSGGGGTGTSARQPSETTMSFSSAGDGLVRCIPSAIARSIGYGSPGERLNRMSPATYARASPRSPGASST